MAKSIHLTDYEQYNVWPIPCNKQSLVKQLLLIYFVVSCLFVFVCFYRICMLEALYESKGSGQDSLSPTPSLHMSVNISTEVTTCEFNVCRNVYM